MRMKRLKMGTGEEELGSGGDKGEAKECAEKRMGEDRRGKWRDGQGSRDERGEGRK